MPSAVEDDTCAELRFTETRINYLILDAKTVVVVTMYADDGLYSFASNSRDLNQDKIDKNMQTLKDFLNSNGLESKRIEDETH